MQGAPPLSARDVFVRTSLSDRDLSAVSQAGLVNNLNDGMVWGLFPIFYATAGLDIERIGWLAAMYPGVWGIGQLFTGALSDRWGRKRLIAAGMWIQAIGIALVAASANFVGYSSGAVLLGAGTALVYPTLLAAIGDVAHPSWRASAVGVYRLWRDLGYAVGAVLAGVTADALGLEAAIWLVALLTFASGCLVAVRMRETRGAASKGPEADWDQRRGVSPRALKDALAREPVLVVDVRSPAEFSATHIDGSVNIPLDSLSREVERLRGARTIVTVCTTGGGRSERAARLLRDHGCQRVWFLRGGVNGWRELHGS